MAYEPVITTSQNRRALSFKLNQFPSLRLNPIRFVVETIRIIALTKMIWGLRGGMVYSKLIFSKTRLNPSNSVSNVGTSPATICP